jgi:hypothetical protein
MTEPSKRHQQCGMDNHSSHLIALALAQCTAAAYADVLKRRLVQHDMRGAGSTPAGRNFRGW